MMLTNRKVLAASKELHIKLTGSAVDPKHAKSEIDLIRLDDNEPSTLPPSNKRKHQDNEDFVKLDKVLELRN